MSLSSDVQAYIDAAGAQFGVSSDYLGRVAMIESNGNPLAKARTTSASGLFQFLKGTAGDYGLTNPFDAQASSYAAANLTADNSSFLQKVLGRSASYGELYLAHQQGAKGAAALLSNPGALAASIVGKKAVLNNGGSLDMTAADFSSIWTSKFSDMTGTAVGAAMIAANPMAAVASAVMGQKKEEDRQTLGFWDIISDFFLRGVIIMLGLIFVAIGLSMFRNGTSITVATQKVVAKAKGAAT